MRSHALMVGLLLMVSGLGVVGHVQASQACDHDDDAGSGSDAGSSDGSSSHPPVVIAPGTHSGCLDDGQGDREDRYAFSVSEGDLVRVQIDVPDGCDSMMAWLMMDGTQGSDDSQVECTDMLLGATAPRDGTMYLDIWAYQDGQAAYTFTLEVGELPRFCSAQDEGGTGRDVSPTSKGELADEAQGCMDLFDLRDDYTHPVEAGYVYRFELATQDPCTTIGIGFEHEDGQGAGGVGATRCTDGQVRWFNPGDAERLTVYLHRFEGETEYTLSVQRCVYPVPPVVTGNVNDPVYGTFCTVEDGTSLV